MQEHSRSCRASGARPLGPLTRPHGKALATRREERPISRLQHLRDPNGKTHRCSGATAGDNPKDPLNNRVETRLKPAKNAKHKSTRTPKRVRSITTTLMAPAARQHKHCRRPSNEVRLARGIDAPSGGDRLARGLHAPSGGVRLARGLNPSLEQSPPCSRAGHPLGWGPLRSRAPTRASPAHFPRTHAHLLPHARTGI
jgi:hypothetical protein